MDVVWSLLKAFLIGGALCAIGQIMIDKTRLTPAKILTGYVVSGVILTAAGLYEPLVKFAGAGATVPLTGFGYALAKSTKEAVADMGLFGALTGPLTGTAAGITAAIVLALLAGVLVKPKNK